MSRETRLNKSNNTGRGALTGTYSEVSCAQWAGASADSLSLWNGACLRGDSAPNWPSVACGNQGQSLRLNGIGNFYC